VRLSSGLVVNEYRPHQKPNIEPQSNLYALEQATGAAS
jgi:hypothetical protein